MCSVCCVNVLLRIACVCVHVCFCFSVCVNVCLVVFSCVVLTMLRVLTCVMCIVCFMQCICLLCYCYVQVPWSALVFNYVVYVGSVVWVW